MSKKQKLDEEHESERAFRAVRAFYKMLPTFRGFIYALTGKKMPVHVDNMTYTDGKSIYIRPPIELGDRLFHGSSNDCGKRIGLQLTCKACKAREEVMIHLYHEIAHHTGQSFKAASLAEVKWAVKKRIEFGRKDDAECKAELKHIKPGNGSMYYGLAHLASPYLHTVIKHLEDLRVNDTMYTARPGTRVMYNAMSESYIKQWDMSEIHLNTQVMLALMDIHDERETYISYYSDPVKEVVKDSEILRILRRMQGATHPRDSLFIGYDLLKRLRELGFMQDEESESGEGNDGEEGSSSGSNSQKSQGENSPNGNSNRNSNGADGQNSESKDDSKKQGSAPRSDDSSSQDSSEGSGSGDPEKEKKEEVDASDDSPGESKKQKGDPGESDIRTRDEDDKLSSPKPPDSKNDSSNQSGDRGSGDMESQQDDSSAPQGEMGTPEQIDKVIGICSSGDQGNKTSKESDGKDGDSSEIEISGGGGDSEDSIAIAILQSLFYDKSSRQVGGIQLRYVDDGGPGWDQLDMIKTYGSRSRDGLHEVPVPESVLGSTLLKLRVALADNKRAKNLRNLKSGKIDGHVLGKRASLGDDRLFKKKLIPSKKDYFVVIGLDCSGSTSGQTIEEIKAAASGMAETCSRLGISFSMYAHSGHYPLGKRDSYSTSPHIMVIKDGHQPWDTQAKLRLKKLAGFGVNLDGHSLEFYRKQAEKRSETDVILMYFTDGAMPAGNFEEELAILQENIQIARRRGFTLMAVGVGTDSPIQHGFDTVLYMSPEDLPNVVKHLEKRLNK